MTIDNITSELMSKIPYSKKYQKVREKIKKSLEKEYTKYRENNDNLTSITIILNNYGTLEKAAILAGYKIEEIQSWKENDDIIDFKTFISNFKKEKRSIICFSIFIVLTICYIISSVIYLTIFNVLFSVIPFILSLIFLRKIINSSKITYNFSFETYDEIQNIEDKYHKKAINSILLGIAVSSITLTIILAINFRLTEIISRIMSNITVFEIILVCIIKNMLINWNLKQKIESIYENKCKIQLKTLTIFSSIYWSLALITTYLLKNQLRLITLTIFIIIFLIIYIIYLFKKRKHIVKKNININKKRILSVIICILGISLYQIMKLDSWILQPFINAVETVNTNNLNIEYNDRTGVYTMYMDDDDFKILQLTDIHLGGSSFSYHKDLKALHSVYKLIEHTKPDLVIVTGDLVFPLGIMSMSFNNNTPIMEFASYMRNIGVPWAFAYGNHDTESLATLTEKEVDNLFKMLSYKNSKNLLYPYKQPNITGRNNQMIEIRKQNGELLEALFLLDSNSYLDDVMDNYDYIHDDQVEWYENQIKNLTEKEEQEIESMLFFHMPLNEYQIAYDLYKQNSEEVEYHFGKIGEENEAICDSNYHSKLFETAVKLGSTKAMFCGHDHLNNISLTYKGIRLTYGLSIDYLAYPKIENKKDQRGGTLITIHEDKTFDIEQIKEKDL